MSVVANVAINVDGKQAKTILDEIKRKVEAMNGTFGNVPGATQKVGGLTSAIAGMIPQLAIAATTMEVLRQSVSTAFERGGAEQRLRNLTSSTGEFNAAIASATGASAKFGISQTEATVALADVYGRLKGVGFGLKETTQIYEGFNVAAKQSGISGADAAGVFFQLSQALGKGKLNGDEFVSVSERMPQLLDLIAQSTGRSRGELQQMAQQGEITSDVLYRALATAAEGSGDLNAKLTEQQRTMGKLAQVTDQLKAQIGNVFAPVVVAGAQGLAVIGEKLSEWWGYLGSQVFPKLLKALKPAIDEFRKLWTAIPWSTILGYLQGSIILALNRIIGVVRVMAPITAFIIRKFLELSNNPVFKFFAEQAAKLVERMGVTNNAVDTFTAKQAQARNQVAQTVNAYSSMPPKIEAAAEKNKGLIAATNSVLNNLRAQRTSLDAQIAALERGATITSARFAAEKAINDLRGVQLEREYQLAKTAQQRFNIAVAIFNQQAQAAVIEYRQALDNIRLEKIKGELQLQSARLKYDEIRAEGFLQILKAKNVEEETAKRQKLGEALQAQNAVIDSTADQVAANKELNRYQAITAEAQYNAKILTAQTALEQKLVSGEIGLTQASALEVSRSLANAYSSSQFMAQATSSIAINSDKSAGNFIRVATNAEVAATKIREAADAQERLNGLRGQATTSTVRGKTPVKRFAQGGFVSRPTLGLIGEAGESEYIVPESKAAGFVSNYLSGVRGASAVAATPTGSTGGSTTINVTTGPVMEFDGQRYVTVADMERAMRLTAEGVIGRLRTPSARIALGMA
jgi:tape measure domain-containing protein